jgi:5-methylcytosine-specific restriction endonuclease McrA
VTPRRWTPNTRAWAYRYLVLRDGEQCAICHAIPTTQNENDLRTTPIVSPTARNHKIHEQNDTEKPGSTATNQNIARTNSIVSPTTELTLDIDHIDGNPNNNHPDNLRLLCRRCNVAASNKSDPRKNYSSDLRERERKEGRPSTRIAKRDANYREGSPEMQANLLYEVPFRRWLMRKVTTEGSYDRNTAIAEGAELVGCSPLTTARYVTKLTSPSGPLLEMDDALHHRILILKPHLQTPTEAPPASFGSPDA